MASPEVELARRHSEEQQPNYEAPNEEIKKSGDEKRGKNDSSSSLGNEADDEEVTCWQYLEFETELPSPAYLSHSTPDDLEKQSRNPPPQCPNLKKYTSPFLWSEGRKSVLVWISCIATMFTAFNAGAYTSGLGQMTDEWHISEVVGLLGVTLFTVGFGIAPMFLAPFSEINGRRPVFLVTGVLWVVFQVVSAVSPTFGGMCVCRFLTGCMSSTFSTMVGGVLSDIYHAKDRNTAMALFSASALGGTGLGPLVCGFIAQHKNWRWIFYVQIIVDGILIIFVIFFFHETRGSVLLSRKAKALNKWYDQLEAAGYYGVTSPATSSFQKTTIHRIRWKCLADEERSSLTTMLKISLLRPFHMLITEPTVFFFSLWISFSWAVLYMTFSAVPLIYETTFHFTLEQSGAVFASICIASILFGIIAVYQDRIGMRYLPESQKRILRSPEGRLYFACFSSALLPIGCIWFGVSGAYESSHWITPALGVACATMGVGVIYLAVFNYLADSYHRYASSALAAQSFCRNMLAGAFPLFTRQMFRKMTFQSAGGFLGGVGFLLTAVPWVLLLFGPKIRAKSKLAGEVMK